jgi:DNA-binding NarL/FixJ family response regulator
MPEAMPHRVFVVDDHPLVRESLKTLVNQQADLCVCGEAADAAAALERIETIKPKLVVMDISLPDTSGLELLRAVKAKVPASAVLILSMHDEKLYAERCIRGGAQGYIMKIETPARIMAAMRQVIAGRRWLSDDIAAVMARKLPHGVSSGSPLEDLSNRELEVFSLLGQGLQTRKIAGTLGVSIKTVQAYCARIKQKLHLNSAAELLREAIRWHEA